MSAIDFGRTATDYAKHRAGFPDSLFERLAAFGVGLPGQRLLDLGTGTGTLARGFARRGCSVTGLDRSEAMLEQARELDVGAGVGVEYVAAPAEETGLPSEAFDVVTAGQCWHWFDVRRAAAEAARLLAPGGRLAIAYYDWLPLRGNVVQATEELIRAHNPEWRYFGGTGIHGEVVRPVQESGFQSVQTFSYDEPALYSHEGWRGRIRASAGVAASLPPDRVEAFDRDLRDLLARDFPEEPLTVEHRVWALVCTRR